MSDALCVVGRVVAAALVGGLGGKASAAIFFALDGVYEWWTCVPGMVLGSSVGVVVAMHPDSSPPLSLIYVVVVVALVTNTPAAFVFSDEDWVLAALLGGLGPAVAASLHSARRALRDMRRQMEIDETSARRQRRHKCRENETSNGGRSITPQGFAFSSSSSHSSPGNRDDSFGTAFDGRLSSDCVALDVESSPSPSSSSSSNRSGSDAGRSTIYGADTDSDSSSNCHSSNSSSAPKWGYTPPPPPIRRILNELKPLPNEPPPMPVTRLKEAPSSSSSTSSSPGSTRSSRASRSAKDGNGIELSLPEALPPYNSWLDRHRRRAPTQKDLLDELGLGSDDDDDDEEGGKRGSKGLYSYLFGVPW